MPHSADANRNENGMDRRKFLLAGGSLMTVAVLGGAEDALADAQARDSVTNLVITKMESRESSRIVGVTRLDNGAPIKVATAPGTVLPAPDATNRSLSEVTVGETVIIIAPEAGAAASGSTVTAQRVVHCNFGIYADAERIRARESR